MFKLTQWTFLETYLYPLLTFLTLCGFLSLRHLRMSISVVLTQPGCRRRRRQRTECVCVSGSDSTISSARLLCPCLPHTIRHCLIYFEARRRFRPNLTLPPAVFKILILHQTLSVCLLLHHLTLLSLVPCLLLLTHHRPMDVPERPLLAVQDLPLSFVLLPVDPVNRGEKPLMHRLWNVRSNTINLIPEPRRTHAHSPIIQTGQSRGVNSQRLGGYDLSDHLTEWFEGSSY